MAGGGAGAGAVRRGDDATCCNERASGGFAPLWHLCCCASSMGDSSVEQRSRSRSEQRKDTIMADTRSDMGDADRSAGMGHAGAVILTPWVDGRNFPRDHNFRCKEPRRVAGFLLYGSCVVQRDGGIGFGATGAPLAPPATDAASPPVRGGFARRAGLARALAHSRRSLHRPGDVPGVRCNRSRCPGYSACCPH